jgi:hypothetical protein
MFKLFKRRQQPSAAAHGWVKVGYRITQQQRKLADYLQKRMRRLSPRAQASVIMGICFLITSCSLFVLYQGVREKQPALITNPPFHSLKIDTLK